MAPRPTVAAAREHYWDNPPPPPKVEPVLQTLNVWSALAFIVGTSAGFGFVGMLLGVAIAGFIPTYYREIFGAVNDPSFEPYAVGLGLGLTQGIFCGLVSGSVVLISVAIASRRR